ncbi:hypothetical protein BJV82DRAFT_608676 [Fennellomyces sp. T-0311]|nr:hypothetical protein BJV82DRAFT_608676 [Fennellomyces sp. T-0311]
MVISSQRDLAILRKLIQALRMAVSSFLFVEYFVSTCGWKCVTSLRTDRLRDVLLGLQRCVCGIAVCCLAGFVYTAKARDKIMLRTITIFLLSLGMKLKALHASNSMCLIATVHTSLVLTQSTDARNNC